MAVSDVHSTWGSGVAGGNQVGTREKRREAGAHGRLHADVRPVKQMACRRKTRWHAIWAFDESPVGRKREAVGPSRSRLGCCCACGNGLFWTTLGLDLGWSSSCH